MNTTTMDDAIEVNALDNPQMRDAVSGPESERSAMRLMVIFPFLGGSAIGGFGVHRLLTGDYMLAAFDLFVAISFYSLGVYTYWTGKETAARYISAVLSTLGPLVFLRMFDSDGIHWVYSSAIVIYYLVPYRWAIAMNLVMLLGVAVVFQDLNYSSIQLYTFLVTIGLINMFSLLFALNERRSRQMLQALTVKDELTGIGNRRAFSEQISETLSMNKRYGLPSCLVCLDIDRFKSVNDSMGHAAGDRAIQSLATHIKSMLRESDHVFRLGGDEFVIIADGADQESALMLTEKIRKSVEAQSLIPERKLTVSLGVALLNAGDTTETWLARADAQLYQAKNAGRNSVAIAE